MSKQNYTVRSKGDYNAFRKKHQTVQNGTIYENNIVTLSNFDELFTTEAETYSDFGFRFNVKGGTGMQRRHTRGGWVASGDTNCLSDVINGSKFGETEESILDFVYYGSALKLFQSSISHIIETFPGELYFTGQKSTTIEGTQYYFIENQYNVQLDSKTVLTGETDDQLKYFNVSYDKYEIISGDSAYDIVEDSLVINKNKAKCGDHDLNLFIESTVSFKIDIDGTEKEINILSIYCNGTQSYVYSDASLLYCSIRPKSSIFDEYYSGLSEFEKVLINPSTCPKYTSNFRTYTESNGKYVYNTKAYTWPSVNNYNPENSGLLYQKFISSIVSLCDFYDEHITNNMWRNLTHEAIKGLDWTFRRDGEEQNIDSSKIEAIEHIYGRLYDDLKYYIDNFKEKDKVGNKTNKEVLQDLSSQLTCKGFDCASLNLCDSCDDYTPVLYKSMTEGYSCSEGNIVFLKNILKNANYLNSIKGTRFGVETMLKMFGLEDDEIEVNEYTYVAKANSDLGRFNETISGVSYPNAASIEDINANCDIRVARSNIEDGMEGIPVNYVTMIKDNQVVRYAVPWYSQDKDYDSGLYFQMNGGWLKRFKKDINLIIAPNITEIESDDTTKLYTDSKNIIQFCGKMSDILLISSDSIDNDIVYVYNISGMNDEYHFGPNEAQSGYTHYFILENSEKSNTIGYDDNTDTYGWRNIKEIEFASASTLTSAARRVLYYESLYEVKTGNSPHCGNGKYDDGSLYLQYLSQPFKYVIDNDLLSRYTEEEILEIAKIRFNLENYIDNRKCWYFANKKQDNNYLFESENGGTYQDNRDIDICVSGSSNFMGVISGGNVNCTTIPVNPEGGDYNDSSAANSIVNVKNLIIRIKLKNEDFRAEFAKFFDDIISRYLSHMIPSSSICTVIIEGIDEDKFTVKFNDYVELKTITYNNVPYGSSLEDPYNGKY